MSRIYVANHVTLDGVMQGPGRVDEDTRDGFTAGGWAAERQDAVIGDALNARVDEAGGMRLLLGRWSYDDMLGHWNEAGGPFKDGLNSSQKYVVSANATESLRWPNSTLVTGDVASDVAELKDQPGADLCIMGSGTLITSLLAAGLVDELLLFIHPLVLGNGHRLFDGDHQLHLTLTRSLSGSTGVVVAHYLVG